MTLLWLCLVACGEKPAPTDTGDTGADGDSAEQIGDSDDTGEDSEDSGDVDDTAEAAEEEARYEAFFDRAVVQRIDLTLDDLAIASLDQDPATYVLGGLTIGDVSLAGVGVRLKGADAVDGLSGKPSFKVKVNEFAQGQRYGTLERLTLNNMADDPTQSKEVLGYALWEAAGLVVPRANYAEVYVNGELYGLYANVETVDEHFLDRRWTEDAGDLWEADDSADFTSEGLDNFQLVAGEGDDDRLGLTYVAVWGADFWSATSAYVDMTQFLDFWAWSIVSGNNDGYPYQTDDYFLYGDPADDLYDYTPWGFDELWDPDFDPLVVSGALAVNCFQDTTCSDALDVAVDTALVTYAGLDFVTEAEAIHAVSASAVSADPRRTGTAGEVTVARTALLAYLETWPTGVRTLMGL